MNFLCSMDLKLRSLLFYVFKLIAPFVSKTGVTKIRVKGGTLGAKIYWLFIKALSYNLPEPIQVHGMIMYQGISQERCGFGSGYILDYEPETCRVFKQIVKRSMTVVDIGANIGYYTLLAAKLVGSKGKVYAFEPDPTYYRLLKKNIEVNKLSTIVESFNSAIGNTQKQTALFLGKLTSSSFFKLNGITTDKTAIVDVISLDEFIAQRNWSPVHIIKMDIEGAEKIALEGMRTLLKRNQELKLIIELNPLFLEAAGTTAQNLLVLFGEFGFNHVRILSGNTGFYKIPQDIQYLVNLGKEMGYVNLLCQR